MSDLCWLDAMQPDPAGEWMGRDGLTDSLFLRRLKA
jgi:hypothetical protein